MLSDILTKTAQNVNRNKELFPIKLLENSIYFDSTCVSLAHYLSKKDKSGIIAEFKRKSPSHGLLNPYAQIIQTSIGYMQSGASALSVVTEKAFFMGRNEDLTMARNANYCPILRKDFIIDEYQVIETKSIGADAILLIAACMEKLQLKNLYTLSRSLGLEVIFEIHDKEELKKIPGPDVIIGINNRNLATMKVDLQTSFDTVRHLPAGAVFISESGLNNIADIKRLRMIGYTGFLIGEHFMKSPDPAEALKQFVNQLAA